MGELDGRVALVTGCAKQDGLGSATARRLAAKGAAVLVCDLGSSGALNEWEDEDEQHTNAWGGLASLEAELGARGVAVATATGDVTRSADAQALIDAALERFGRLDILINNAAAPHGPDRNDIERVPLEAYEQVMAVNIQGPFLMCQAAIPAMRQNQWGRIVNISSIRGKIGRRHHAVYSASKAAVLGFTHSLAIDLGPDQITVNAVCPGQMFTSRSLSLMRRAGRDDVQAELRDRAGRVPLGRVGRADDVAAVVAFLATEDAGYLTGQAITVDGGENPF